MSRRYTVQFENVSIAAAQDLFAIVPASNKPIKILGFSLAPVGGVADVGDAEEENWRLSLIRGHTTAGSGGSAPTAAPVNPIDTAAGATARVNDTTVASAGTAVTVWSGGVNVRAGIDVVLPEEMQFSLSVATANNRFVLRMLSTPADAVLMSGTLWFKEVH